MGHAMYHLILCRRLGLATDSPVSQVCFAPYLCQAMTFMFSAGGLFVRLDQFGFVTRAPHRDCAPLRVFSGDLTTADGWPFSST